MSNAKERDALRDLLQSGPTDPLVMETHALLEELQAAVAKGNTKQQLEIGRKLAANGKAIQAVGAEQRAAMLVAIERALSIADDEDRTAQLCAAFALCAEIQVVANDAFGGGESVDQAIDHKHAIVAALDAMTPGRRSALASLLDSPHPGVRASAGAHLLNANLMRERVIPVLQEIEGSDDGSAGWTAFWALSPNDHGKWLTGEAGAN